MVSAGMCLLDSLALIQTVLKLSQMYAMELDVGRNNTKMPNEIPNVTPRVVETKEEITVERFAKHVLCKDFDGKKRFYMALKSKFCSLKWNFTAKHALDLCSEGGFLLNKWVAELYDLDEDGFISHHEKTFYMDT